MYNAEILLDSFNPDGLRLTTMRVTMPRFILAEFNTHRDFSRNAGSSRAISINKRIEQVRTNPFIPGEWGKNQKGMQANSLVTPDEATMARQEWIWASQQAADAATHLSKLGIHKQWANRLLEPFSWVTVIVSSTRWDNFFHQRISSLAQPEMQIVAQLMKDALDASSPELVRWGEWHTPLSFDREVAVGRLARVSYESDPKTDDEDRQLCRRLMRDGHWSPFEHVAKAAYSTPAHSSRNFCDGWVQMRAMIDTGV